MTTTQRPSISEIAEANIAAGFDQRDEPDYGQILLGSVLAHAQNAQDTAHENGYDFDQGREAFYRVVGSLVGQHIDGFEFLKLAQFDTAIEIDIDGRIIRVGHHTRRTIYFVVSESGYILATAATRIRAEAATDPLIRLVAKITIPKRPNQWDEFHCKAFDQDGKRYPEADYHTDCRQDAEDTREMLLSRFQR
jgi:hypothetical protein